MTLMPKDPRRMPPAAAVEAASKALFARAIPATTGGLSWDKTPECRMKEDYREDARRALEAAAPYMLTELRAYLAREIHSAENAEAFYDYAKGYAAALTAVDKHVSRKETP